MKLKKSRTEEFEDNQEFYKAAKNGIVKFAWFPTELECGSKVWLENYIVDLNIVQFTHGESKGKYASGGETRYSFERFEEKKNKKEYGINMWAEFPEGLREEIERVKKLREKGVTL